VFTISSRGLARALAVVLGTGALALPLVAAQATPAAAWDQWTLFDGYVSARIEYNIQPTVPTNFHGQVIDSARAWTSTPTPITLAQQSNPRTETVLVLGANFASNSVTGNASCLTVSSNRCVESRVRMNLSWNGGRNGSEFLERPRLLGRMFVHEFGHIIGLDHTMTANGRPCTPNKQGCGSNGWCNNQCFGPIMVQSAFGCPTEDRCTVIPNQDDINGVNAIYQPESGTSACLLLPEYIETPGAADLSLGVLSDEADPRKAVAGTARKVTEHIGSPSPYDGSC
jgi:hypothetical protein